MLMKNDMGEHKKSLETLQLQREPQHPREEKLCKDGCFVHGFGDL